MKTFKRGKLVLVPVTLCPNKIHLARIEKPDVDFGGSTIVLEEFCDYCLITDCIFKNSTMTPVRKNISENKLKMLKDLLKSQ